MLINRLSINGKNRSKLGKLILLAWCLLFIVSSEIYSQSDYPPLADIVYLDSVVVRATRSGFSVSDFIELVQTDRSFYLAFRNLRYASFEMDTDMQFQNRHGKTRGRYLAKHHQKVDNNCRYMEVISEDIEGRFKGRGDKYRYYTAELYDRLFITHDTVCGLGVPPTMSDDLDLDSQKGHVAELKKLLFTPGMRSTIPFIGRKTEIFSEQLRDYYQFSIRSSNYRGDSVYVFTASLKPEFQQRKQQKTVIKELATYFSQRDFQVLGRSYRLAYDPTLYQFDVTMNVELTRIGDYYFPQKIEYDGGWNVPFKKAENATFSIGFSNMRLGTNLRP